jgi:hypothetical protein
VLIVGALLWSSAPAAAQEAAGTQAPPAQDPAATDQAPPERADPDARVDPLEPDFNLAALPTTLRMPSRKLAFRVTHRFTRSLGQGSFRDLLTDAFGFDGGAQVGLEFRYGLRPGTQIGIHRTSDRAIQIFGQHSVLSERHGRRMGLDAIVGIEGENNLRAERRGIVGALASKKVSTFGTIYAEPIWVTNTNALDAPGTDNNTLMLGLGTRLRVRRGLYLVGEVTPRLAGYDPGVSQGSVAIEGRAGGHLFQLNFSNGWGTTLSQLARASTSSEDQWYIGFNIARKFF